MCHIGDEPRGRVLAPIGLAICVIAESMADELQIAHRLAVWRISQTRLSCSRLTMVTSPTRILWPERLKRTMVQTVFEEVNPIPRIVGAVSELATDNDAVKALQWGFA